MAIGERFIDRLSTPGVLMDKKGVRYMTEIKIERLARETFMRVEYKRTGQKTL